MGGRSGVTKVNDAYVKRFSCSSRVSSPHNILINLKWKKNVETCFLRFVVVSGAKASETLTMIIHKRNDLLRFLGLLLMYIKNYTYNPIISNFSFLSEGKENLKTSHSSDYL